MKQIGTKYALAIAHKMMDELVFNMAKLEGNSLSFAETKTVLDGISIPGKPMRDLHQVEYIKSGWMHVIEQVKNDQFTLTKDNFIAVNAKVAAGDNISPGQFRDQHVNISGTEYMPPMPMLLSDLFRSMIEDQKHPFDLFLDTARNQYFQDGNKRTGLLMTNGVLMQSGYTPISISPKDQVKFIENLITFYESGDKAAMFVFLEQQQQRYVPEDTQEKPKSRGR